MKKDLVSFVNIFVIISIFFIVITISCLSFNKVYAQSANLNGIVITTDPEYPIPASTVKVKMETYQFDTDVADIVWYYNGKQIDRGIGKKQIEIKYPKLGIIAEIRAVATLGGSGGQNFAGGRMLGGSTINLLYTPIDSYKPAWYTGASMPAEGGKVKMYAEAYLYSNGKQIPADNLIYNWNINEDPQSQLSGLGKKTAIIDMDPIVGEAYVTVTVKSIDGLYETKSATRVIPVSPSLYIYYNSNTVFPTHIDYDYTMHSAETMISAEPFNALIDKDIKYSWTVNGLLANSTAKTFIIRRPTVARGQVNMRIDYNNDKKLYQTATYNGVIYFE